MSNIISSEGSIGNVNYDFQISPTGGGYLTTGNGLFGASFAQTMTESEYTIAFDGLAVQVTLDKEGNGWAVAAGIALVAGTSGTAPGGALPVEGRLQGFVGVGISNEGLIVSADATAELAPPISLAPIGSTFGASIDGKLTLPRSELAARGSSSISGNTSANAAIGAVVPDDSYQLGMSTNQLRDMMYGGAWTNGRGDIVATPGTAGTSAGQPGSGSGSDEGNQAGNNAGSYFNDLGSGTTTSFGSGATITPSASTNGTTAVVTGNGAGMPANSPAVGGNPTTNPVVHVNNQGSYFSDFGTPIVLDLDKDGAIELVGVDASTAFFDYAGDGFREKTGWATGGDGFLAMDLDLNGNITTTELAFGNLTTADDTDLEAFAAVYDSNDDGKFTSTDTKWLKARTWEDKNHDGTVDDGELLTLAQSGITSISLKSDHKVTEQDGNTIFGIAQAQLSSGGTMQVADVAFSASTIGVSGNSRTGTRMTTPDGKQSFVVTSTKGVTINADQKQLLAITGGKGNDWPKTIRTSNSMHFQNSITGV